jgi:hypothetical protein
MEPNRRCRQLRRDFFASSLNFSQLLPSCRPDHVFLTAQQWLIHLLAPLLDAPICATAIVQGNDVLTPPTDREPRLTPAYRLRLSDRSTCLARWNADD